MQIPSQEIVAWWRFDTVVGAGLTLRAVLRMSIGLRQDEFKTPEENGEIFCAELAKKPSNVLKVFLSGV